jgi:putative transcriptional regulator
MMRRYCWPVAIAAAVVCGTLLLQGQAVPGPELGIGKLVVARRDAPDPAFAETVILLVRYDHTGTLGLMINRPTKVPISRALDPLKGAKGRSDPVYAGGPVELPNVLGLLKANAMPDGAAHVTGKVYLLSSEALLEKTLAGRPDPEDFRVYLGYCGWGPGQLESESSRGFWQVLNANADIIFDAEPDTLWSRLIARAEQRIARANPPAMPVRGAAYRALDQAPACAANPSMTAMLEVRSGGSPCRFSR